MLVSASAVPSLNVISRDPFARFGTVRRLAAVPLPWRHSGRLGSPLARGQQGAMPPRPNRVYMGSRAFPPLRVSPGSGDERGRRRLPPDASSAGGTGLRSPPWRRAMVRGRPAGSAVVRHRGYARRRVILTECREVDSESRRQPAVFIARSATNARTRGRPSLLSLAAGGRSLVRGHDRRPGEALTDNV